LRVAGDGLDEVPLPVVLVGFLIRRGVEDRVGLILDPLAGGVVPRDFEQGAAAFDDRAGSDNRAVLQSISEPSCYGRGQTVSE
jgi:hypothetical protein